MRDRDNERDCSPPTHTHTHTHNQRRIPHPRADGRRSLWLCVACACLVVPWTITFLAGGERLLGLDAWDRLTVLNKQWLAGF